MIKKFVILKLFGKKMQLQLEIFGGTDKKRLTCVTFLSMTKVEQTSHWPFLNTFQLIKMNIISFILNPIKPNFLIIKTYFNALKNIHTFKDLNIILQIKLFCWINIFRSIILLFQYFISFNLFWKILLFDFISILAIPNEFKLSFSIIFYLTYKFLNITYFDPTFLRLCKIYYRILIKNNGKYFTPGQITKNHKICNFLKKYLNYFSKCFLFFTLTARKLYEIGTFAGD